MSKMKTSTFPSLFQEWFEEKTFLALLSISFFLTWCTLCAIGSAVDCKCGLWPLLTASLPKQPAQPPSLPLLSTNHLHQNLPTLKNGQKAARDKKKTVLASVILSPIPKQLTASFSPSLHQPLVPKLSTYKNGSNMVNSQGQKNSFSLWSPVAKQLSASFSAFLQQPLVAKLSSNHKKKFKKANCP